MSQREPAINPTRRPTVLLRYPSPFQSSLAPTHDSTGATEPYTASASRALSRLRSQRWVEAALHPRPEEEGEQLGVGVELSEAERRTLVDLGVDIEAFLEGINNNGKSHSASAPDSDGSLPVAKRRRLAPPPPASAVTGSASKSTTAAVWTALERNSELIVSVARAQVARARRSYELGLERTRRKAEAAQRAAAAAATVNRPLVGGTAAGAGAEAGNKVVEEGGGEKVDEGALNEEGERAGQAELEDAKALLDSLGSLLATLPKPDQPDGATTTTSTTPTPTLPRVLPPRAFLSQLAPLLLAARQKEPSFHGTLDPLLARAVKLRENVLPPAAAASMVMGGGIGGGGGGHEMDLRV